jgi:hypothetical protein
MFRNIFAPNLTRKCSAASVGSKVDALFRLKGRAISLKLMALGPTLFEFMEYLPGRLYSRFRHRTEVEPGRIQAMF